MKNIRYLLLSIVILGTLITNLHFLFTDDEIDWSWLFDTELHHWGIYIANILFSLSNLMFLAFGGWVIIDMIEKHDSPK